LVGLLLLFQLCFALAVTHFSFYGYLLPNQPGTGVCR
jgi:hypothetical protein